MLAVPAIALIGAGIALAGSQGGIAVRGVPLFALSILLAFVIQWLVFIPSYHWQTEKSFDLTGSITYLSAVWLAVLLRPRADARTFLLAGLVTVWALRLGTFLFRRIQAAGSDARFNEIKPSWPRFLTVWTLQGLWVSLTLAAALAAITSTRQVELDAFAMVGTLVWLIGLTIEAIADQQKSRFRANPQNKAKFINTGLWAWSRHPNYFGEITLWVGIALIAVPVLQGWQWLTLVSPLFVFVLLTRVSGIPMLEKRADEKWGRDPEYEAYKARTSILVPKPPSAAR
jgi:steroid 5-alpha reductase family enzyme